METADGGGEAPGGERQDQNPVPEGSLHSGDDDGSEAGDGGDNAPKNKQYRRMVDVEFSDKLLVSAMINVKAFGRKDMPFVLWLLVWEWHSQLRDETKHPRKRGFELFNTKQTNCCFKNNLEWSEFDTANRCRGKGSQHSEEEAPTMLSQHQAWSQLKFDKWLDIVRDMQNVIHPAFVRANATAPLVIDSHNVFAGQNVRQQKNAVRSLRRDDYPRFQTSIV